MQSGAIDMEKYGNIATYNFADPQAMCKVTYLYHAVAWYRPSPPPHTHTLGSLHVIFYATFPFEISHADKYQLANRFRIDGWNLSNYFLKFSQKDSLSNSWRLTRRDNGHTRHLDYSRPI